MHDPSPSTPIRIGVSACLLGREVRYDGGHKRDLFLVETLGRYVEWVPVCPEVELGLGTPRPTLRLERRGTDVRLTMPTTGEDHTDAMRGYATKRIARLAHDDLGGYILKKDSPSCGMERVKVYGAHATSATSGRGLFADALMQRYPNLPVEEEGRLNDPLVRENFVERVFAYQRVRALFTGRWRLGDLVVFHTAHKLQLKVHSPKMYQRLGRYVVIAKSVARAEVRARYESLFMQGLAVLATRRRHTSVLHHMAGSLRKRLDDDSMRELQLVIDDYHRGMVPLIVPITLIRHYARRFDVEYLRGQTYLHPHPTELMLRYPA